MSADRKTTVFFAHEGTGNWKAELSQSALFMCLLTPAYLRRPECFEHLQYARLLGKPVRVVLVAGTEVPRGFFHGVRDLEIQTCATPKEAADYIGRVTKALEKEGRH